MEKELLVSARLNGEFYEFSLSKIVNLISNYLDIESRVKIIDVKHEDGFYYFFKKNGAPLKVKKAFYDNFVEDIKGKIYKVNEHLNNGGARFERNFFANAGVRCYLEYGFECREYPGANKNMKKIINKLPPLESDNSNYCFPSGMYICFSLERIDRDSWILVLQDINIPKYEYEEIIQVCL